MLRTSSFSSVKHFYIREKDEVKAAIFLYSKGAFLVRVWIKINISNIVCLPNQGVSKPIRNKDFF